MEMHIRRRLRADLPTCAELLLNVHVDSGYPINWPRDPTGWLSPVGLCAAWVALQDGRLVGHVCLVASSESPGTVKLERLFVALAARRQGVGRALITRATAEAGRRQQGLVLEVADTRDSAVSLYQRLGWRETGRTPIDWGNGVAEFIVHFAAPYGP
jgi:GNAT superfamily N-acetyltransferase